MLLSLALFALTIVAGLFALAAAIRHAPEGHEDRNGFHFKHKADAEVHVYNAFAGQQPKRYPVKVSHPQLAA